MVTYKFEWEKDGRSGNFVITALSDEECVKVGNKEVEDFGGEVLDYYQVDTIND